MRVPPIDPPDRPLPRVGVETAYRCSPIPAGRQVEDVVIDIDLPIKQGPHPARPIKDLPVGTSKKSLLQSPMADFPPADQKVEIV
jgi:hypothetical protein